MVGSGIPALGLLLLMQGSAGEGAGERVGGRSQGPPQPPVQTHLLVSILITTGMILSSYLKYKKFTSEGSNTGRATGLPEDSEAARNPEFWRHRKQQALSLHEKSGQQ